MRRETITRVKVIVTLDVMMARRKVKGKDLAEYIGITEANLSLLKQGRVRGIRFDTLSRICEYLDCLPGDLMHLEPDSSAPGDGDGVGLSADDVRILKDIGDA